MPLLKVLGTENSADLMTKNLGADMIKKHTSRLRLEFRAGRSGKAAQLQGLSRRKAHEDNFVGVLDRYAERRGGDLWHSRGAGGSWIRIHSAPRRSLFTPCRVPRGPAHPDKLSGTRVTKGIHCSGNKFVVEDNWMNPDCAHRVLDLPWTGSTTFASVEPVQVGGILNRQKWADVEDDAEERSTSVKS